MDYHSFIQGSQEWHAHRATKFNASDAPAMMGCSSYKSRADLVRERATGIIPDVDEATQRRFNDGHKFEALARPLAEVIIGADLYPVTGSSGQYSASFDGLTIDEAEAFEHKSLNDRLRAAMHEGCTGADLPLEYQVQMEHQAMVSGCERILFMASRWEIDGYSNGEYVPTEYRYCWYTPNHDLRARIVAGWAQFDKDVAAYVPTEQAAPVVAAPMESLPAVVVQVQGALTVAGNLPAFGEALRAFIERIPAKPATDQQFADAEAACKALKKAEDALAQAEDGALAQINDVELMRRTVADLKNLARTTRLATEKLVKSEKDTRRAERVLAARSEFDKHVARLQTDIKGIRLIVQAPDFGGAIKGLSSLASIDEKLTAALIAGKAEANTIAGRIVGNLQTLDSVPAYAHLFADRQELAYKPAEVLELLMQKRVDAEQARIEAERQRIRAEEQHRAQMEAAERIKQERERARATIEANRPALEAAAKAFPISFEPATEPGVCFRDPPENIVEATSVDEPDNEPTLKLGDINARLAPLSINAAGLAHFGITALARDKNAQLFSEAQFGALLGHLARHIHIRQTEVA